MNATTDTGRFSGKSGTILLETIIAIPLYMILLGGIMWLGDLMVARQKLVIADRYAVWNYGCRYNPGGFDAETIHQRFFDSSEYRNPSEVKTDKEDFDWCLAASGEVKLKMKMPDWTRSMFNARAIMADQTISPGALDEEVDLVGRSLGGGHLVLMRTKSESEPGYIRNKYGVSESGQVTKYPWTDIYNEKWPFDSKGSFSSVTPKGHERDSQYQTWSK
ncbi:MAG: hypothetical protein WCO42_00515 [bacterium]